MATKANLELKRGNDYVIPLQAESDEASPDFTGWKASFMVKTDIKDDDASAKIYQLTDLNSDGYGEITIDQELTRSLQPGEYVYDCRVINSEGKAGNSNPGILEVDNVVNTGTRDNE